MYLAYNMSFSFSSYSSIKHGKQQPDLTEMFTYFTRWLIRMTSLLKNNTIFAKSCVFYELPIHMNLYEWPTPNPTPKPSKHSLDKSYNILTRMN